MKRSLKRQQREEVRRTLELAMEQARLNRGEGVREAGPELAALQIYEILSEFNPRSLKESLEGDVERYAKLVRLVVELSENGLKYERYRQEVAARKAAMLKALEVARDAGLTKEAFDGINQQMMLL